MNPKYQNRIELLQGTLDLLILQILVWGAEHGYGIGQAIRAQEESFRWIPDLSIPRSTGWKGRNG